MARVVADNGQRLPGPTGLVALTSIAAIGALSAVAFHPLIGFPIAAAALAYAAFAYGVALSATMSVVAGAVGATFALWARSYAIVVPIVGDTVTGRTPIVFGLVMVASMLLIGPIAAGGMRRFGPISVSAMLAADLTVVQVTALAWLARAAGQGLSGFMKSLFETTVTFLSEAGMPGAAPEGMTDMTAQLVWLWPSLAIVVNGVTAVAVIAAIGFAARRAGATVRSFGPLAELDLDPRAVLVPIAAFALLAAERLPVGFAPALGIAGANVLNVARWLFFMQGVAVFAFMYRRAKFGPVVRTVGYAVLFVTESLIPLVSLSGLADVWLNLRKLPRDPGPGVIGAPPGSD